jgi:hypothetical protein
MRLRKITLEEMTPEQRESVEAIKAKFRTPEARAEEQRVREEVRLEFPPAKRESSIDESI